MNSEYMGLAIAGVGLIGFACQWLAWRLKLPAILFLLIAGFVVGPVTHIFQPNDLFGELLFPLISLAVAVILFEGSLTLNFKEIRGVGRSVQHIVTIGALISWAVTSAATYYFLDFDWLLALLFGSLTVVTGPTVVVPLLRTVRPQAKLANILRWEGILIDPIGALFIVIVYEFIMSSSQTHSLEVFGLTLLIGFAIGISAGLFLALILRRNWLPEYLQPFAVLTLVLGAFAISNALEAESGLLTVTVMGMWLANAKGINIQNILHFKENLTILLISGLFILLSARMELSDFSTLGLSAIALFVVIQLVSRPVAIFLSTIGSSLNIREKLFISWVAPRGIVAASISSIFAIKLSQAGVAHADLLVPLTFMVIVGTVVLQSLTARPMAHFLKVAEPLPKGYLIVGANDVARTLALALQKYGFRVVVTDSNWDYIKKARMQGLETYYGNPVSTHAEEYLNLIGIGNLIAMTPDKHFNVVVANYFAKDFGEKSIFCLNGSSKVQDGKEKHEVGEKFHGSILFDEDVSYKKLASLINQGAEIKHTTLSAEFKWEDYVMRYIDGPRIPLFTIDPKENIHIMSPERNQTTGEGWTVISLIKSDKTKITKAIEERASKTD